MTKELLMNGGEESSIYIVTAEHGGGFYTGYSRGPFGTLGDISSNQLKIGNSTYTILAIIDAEEPTGETFLVVDKYIDYSNTQVYISIENSTVYTIDSLDLDSAIAGKHYLLKPTLYQHGWQPIFGYYLEQPTVFNIWISTTPPPWYEDPNGHSGGGAQIG